MVVSVDIKLPKSLGQWHLYHPEASLMKEELSETSKSNVLSELNIFIKWMKEVINKATDNYQLLLTLKSVSSNKVFINDLDRILGNDLVVEYQDKRGQFIFSLDNVFLMNLLGMYFGSDMSKIGSFSFSDMEMVIINAFYSEFFEEYFKTSKFLDKDYKVNYHLGKIETMKFLAANQNLVNVNFNVSFANSNESVIKLFYSEHSSDNFLQRINVKKDIGVSLSDSMKRSITTDAVVQLGKAKLTFGEFMNIQQGDVLVLNNKVGESIKFVLADQLFFNSTVGQSEGKYAIKIEEQIVSSSYSEVAESMDLGESVDQVHEEELLMDSFDEVDVKEELEAEKSVIEEEESAEDEFDWENL